MRLGFCGAKDTFIIYETSSDGLCPEELTIKISRQIER